MRSTGPWQDAQPMPFLTWIEWLKYTNSGRALTRRQTSGLPPRMASRTGSSIGLSFQIWEWQVMQVETGGSPANDEVSTDVWQKRQSSPTSPTWCLWLNGTGCS